MEFYTYEIRSQALKPYLEFILFNYSAENSLHQLTYYPNHDVCLGIIYNNTMVEGRDVFYIEPSGKLVNSYLTGIYTRPHHLSVNGSFDEICLPFTPPGYRKFFRFALKTYILKEDVLGEAFGASARSYFEELSGEKDFNARGRLIESFLLQKLAVTQDDFLSQALHYMHASCGDSSLRDILFHLQCSEKKLQRYFLQQLDVLPKDYLQILRFRKALHLLGQNGRTSLTAIGYEAGYFDQSHFIRQVQSFTGKTPGQLRRQMKSIDDKVLCTFI